ncbi:Aste57867_11452 [Aphanomyces stellatus]|uniref:Aste57867_11452 protein n=1 Tax=Aphanomyces stellatus TaxID=120398 RepID=A0A485KTC2_9STRA|nr:hypothetical protein As57867_011409 [Aphanomyces stellatus]VFT88313.1 Aste57867_11452 [Aphanomyces stellatus]
MAVPTARMRLLSTESLSHHDIYYNHAVAAAPTLLVDPASTFKLQHSADGIHVFEDMGRVKATTTIHQPAHWLLASSLHSPTSHGFRRRMFHYFGNAFANGLCLHNTAADGPVALQWLALKHGAIAYDMAFASTTLTLQVDGDGIKAVPLSPTASLGVQVWSSVPDLVTKPAGVARLSLVSSGFVVEAVDDTTSTVSFVLQFGRATHSPTLAWMRSLAFTAVASFRRSQDPMLPPMLWTGNAYCYLCFKTFGLWHRRHHCRFCGQAICARCMTYVPTAHEWKLATSRRKAARVPACTRCPDAMMQRSVQLFTGIRSPHFGSRTWSAATDGRYEGGSEASWPSTPHSAVSSDFVRISRACRKFDYIHQLNNAAQEKLLDEWV